MYQKATKLIAHIPIFFSIDMNEGTEQIERVNRELTLDDAWRLGIWISELRKVPATRRDAISSTSDNSVEFILRTLLTRSTMLEISDQLERDTKDFRLSLLEEYDADETISQEDGVEAKSLANRWKEAFLKKIENHKVLHVEDSNLLDIDKAMEDPHGFFTIEVWEWLPEQSQTDLEEALKNLAIGSSISSVMISLRATENVLRIWHNRVCEEGNEIESGAWGEVFEELEDIYDDKNERPDVLTDFNYLKDRRNEVNHPDRSPDMEEAQVNIIRVKATIERAHEEIKED